MIENFWRRAAEAQAAEDPAPVTDPLDLTRWPRGATVVRLPGQRYTIVVTVPVKIPAEAAGAAARAFLGTVVRDLVADHRLGPQLAALSLSLGADLHVPVVQFPLGAVTLHAAASSSDGPTALRQGWDRFALALARVLAHNPRLAERLAADGCVVLHNR